MVLNKKLDFFPTGKDTKCLAMEIFMQLVKNDKNKLLLMDEDWAVIERERIAIFTLARFPFFSLVRSLKLLYTRKNGFAI